MTEQDIYTLGIEERANFLAWFRKRVPKKYRVMTETEDCFSAPRDFVTLAGLGFSQLRDRLAEANRKLVGKIEHALGRGKEKGCERCVRIIEAYTDYQARHNTKILTEAANKLVWLNHKQRGIELREIERLIQEADSQDEGIAKIVSQKLKDYHGDRLHLLRVHVPQTGDMATWETHLVFYADTIRDGESAFRKRIRDTKELQEYPGLAELTHFSGPQPYAFSGINLDFLYSSSQEIVQGMGRATTNQGESVANRVVKTVVDIVSKKLKSF